MQHAMALAEPTFSLDRFVEEVRVLAPEAGAASRVERLPDGRTSLVFRELDDRRADVSLAGPRTQAHYKNVTGVARVVMIRFKPGWSTALLGVSAHALTDRIVFLEDVWGPPANDLRDELVEARSVPEIVAHIARAIALRTRQTSEPASAPLARRAVRLLEGGDEVRIDRLADRLGVTARHLRRAFTESVGIGPKEYVRTVRLQRAVRMAETSRDWGQIAVAAGYYDQAHLIADFRELVGLTPGAFARRAAPMT